MRKQESALYQWMQRSERVVSEGDEEKVTAVSQTEGQHEEGNGEGEGGWDFPTREPRVILHNLFTHLTVTGLSRLSLTVVILHPSFRELLSFFRVRHAIYSYFSHSHSLSTLSRMALWVI